MRGNWPRERQQAFILGSGAFFTGLQHIKRCTTWTSRSDDGDNTHTYQMPATLPIDAQRFRFLFEGSRPQSLQEKCQEHRWLGKVVSLSTHATINVWIGWLVERPRLDLDLWHSSSLKNFPAGATWRHDLCRCTTHPYACRRDHKKGIISTKFSGISQATSHIHFFASTIHCSAQIQCGSRLYTLWLFNIAMENNPFTDYLWWFTYSKWWFFQFAT
jgi:hypothetical protein